MQPALDPPVSEDSQQVRRRGIPMKGPAVLVGTVLAVAAAIVHFVVSAIAGIESFEPLGLIHSVPPTFYVSVAASVVALVVLLRTDREHTWMLGVNVVVLAVVLHGTAAVLEGLARFPTAWLHAGYTESVMATNQVATELGARFSWPAFFTATAAVFGGSSEGVPEPVLRWSPVFFQLAYLAPLHVIASRLCASWRTTWLALVFFGFSNWVGQDYFAPQAGAFLLGLCVLATVLRSLVDPPKLLHFATLRGRLGASAGGGSRHTEVQGLDSSGTELDPSGWREQEAEDSGTGCSESLREPGAVQRGPSEQILAVLVVTLLAAALAASHQLTPYALTMQLGALWMVRRLRSLMLPVLVGLMALLWTSWGAVDYWTGHLDDVFGRVGNPGAVIESSIRWEGQSSPAHVQVWGMRVLYAGLLLIGALAGMVRIARRIRGINLTVPALAAAPAALVFLQDYGGEVGLRGFLYATPFLAILLAQLFVPGTQLRRVSALSLVAVLTLAGPLFLVAKYGNESFERVTPSDVALGACLYESAAPGTAIYSMSPLLTWQFTGVVEHNHFSVNENTFDTPDVPALVEELPAADESYVILSESQAVYVERALGGPEGWFGTIRRGFSADPRFDRVCDNDAGAVYRFAPGEG